jgi:hypothetical protein
MPRPQQMKVLAIPNWNNALTKWNWTQIHSSPMLVANALPDALNRVETDPNRYYFIFEQFFA